MPNAGDAVGERYRLTEELASGGMGTIWAAEHLELGTTVAIKLMNKELGADPSYQRRFQREARIVAKLTSPHVVSVLDFGFWESQPYLVMELLRGEDLAARITRSVIEPSEALRILEGIAKALDLAHEAGVIHRDIKPSNIFLARLGDEVTAKVLDFGIAKVADANTTGNTTDHGFVGSPAYMSPEQVWGEALGPATDLWSLGVVAFEMLSGHSPFDGGPLAKTFDLIIRGELPKVTSHRPELPPAVDVALELVLRRDPKERVGTAREFVRGLGEAFAGLDGPTGPARAARVVREADPAAATVLNLERPRARGRPIAWMGVALLALAGIAFGAFALRDNAPTVEDRSVVTGDVDPIRSEAPMPSSASFTPTASASELPVRATTPSSQAVVPESTARTNNPARPVPTSASRTTATGATAKPTAGPRTDSTFGIPQSSAPQ